MSRDAARADPTSREFDVTSLDRKAERMLLRTCALVGVGIAAAGIPVAHAHGVGASVAVLIGGVVALALLALAASPKRYAWSTLAVLVALTWWPCFAWSPFWFFPACLTFLYLLFGGFVLRIRRLP